MAALNWITIGLGVLIVALGLARVLNVGFMKTKRWPGSFASGTHRQRWQLLGSTELGVGIVLLGAGQLAGGAGQRAVALVLLVLGVVAFIVAIVLFARALTPQRADR